MTEKTENPGRERILRRVQAALQSQAALRHDYPKEQIFTPVADPLERFQQECQANQTECFVIPDITAGATTASEVLKSFPEGEIFVQDAPLLRRLASSWETGRKISWSSEQNPSEETQATVTLAESLVAATGSIFVSAACGGRRASIAAPVHIVVATAAQLAPTLETAFAWLHERGAVSRNSLISLITGPSRTGDIEKIIVMGAHGPRRVIVLLLLSDE